MVKTTLNNVLLQGDSMYLEALNSGLIVLDSGVDLLSINNLPSVVYVTCYTDITDNFSYELCTYHLFTPPPRGRANPREFDILEISLSNFLAWSIICWSKRPVGGENWRRFA